MIQVKFLLIDYWNRPVFKSIKSDNYFGSVEKLFDYGANEETVLEKIGASDLVYFGTSLDDDPMGTPYSNLEIIKRDKNDD